MWYLHGIQRSASAGKEIPDSGDFFKCHRNKDETVEGAVAVDAADGNRSKSWIFPIYPADWDVASHAEPPDDNSFSCSTPDVTAQRVSPSVALEEEKVGSVCILPLSSTSPIPSCMSPERANNFRFTNTCDDEMGRTSPIPVKKLTIDDTSSLVSSDPLHCDQQSPPTAAKEKTCGSDVEVLSPNSAGAFIYSLVSSLPGDVHSKEPEHCASTAESSRRYGHRRRRYPLDVLNCSSPRESSVPFTLPLSCGGSNSHSTPDATTTAAASVSCDPFFSVGDLNAVPRALVCSNAICSPISPVNTPLVPSDTDATCMQPPIHQTEENCKSDSPTTPPVKIRCSVYVLPDLAGTEEDPPAKSGMCTGSHTVTHV